MWGGESPRGFDCSGLVAYVYAQVGVSLAHYTVAQWNYPDSVSVPRNQLEPGDLVFFDGLGHVGIYVGGGNFIHAPHTGSSVRIDSLSEGCVRVGVRRREADPRLVRLARVQRFDLVREVLVDDPAAQLQRGRHLALLQ